MRDFPYLKTMGREDKKANPCNVKGVLKIKGRFYALLSKGDQE